MLRIKQNCENQDRDIWRKFVPLDLKILPEEEKVDSVSRVSSQT